jgi:hypothetical protein
MTQQQKKATFSMKKKMANPGVRFYWTFNQELKINCLFLILDISIKSQIVLSNISEGYPAFKTTTDNLYP